MRKLIIQEFVTVDGFAAAADGTHLVPPVDPQLERDQLRFVTDDVDTMLLGRVTYQMFADYWPTATTDTEIVADELNTLSKVVASRSLDHATWGGREDPISVVPDGVEAAADLKRQHGQGIVVWGSLSLAQSLVQAGLVDECHLYVCPSVLGEGRPFFAGNPDLRSITLLEATRYDSGVVLLRYQFAETRAAEGAA